MTKKRSSPPDWQHWLRYSAFTLAGVALEGTMPQNDKQPQPKSRTWRSTH
ncbi:hypothetical protein [[Erwinia] mediterraneensis]|nr:hypothetical protein [[Erwinia] mediterraneensis]